MSSEIIEIDGSSLEGGGQILRMALAFSVLTKRPIRVTNIRAGRSKPGLMEQHLKGVELVRDISCAKVKGAELGSKEIEFWPTTIKGGRFQAAVKTAGSVSLLLQVALPCALFADGNTSLKLKGGTNADMAPQVDYMTEVFRPVLERFGASFDFELVRRGYFPRGGGEVVVNIKPVEFLRSVEMVELGNIVGISGWSYVAGTLPLHLAHTIGDSAAKVLKTVHKNINIERYKEQRNIAPDNGSGIILVAESSTGCVLGSDALGNRNERPEETGSKAAETLLKTINAGACLDNHCQDQVILFMALAQGISQIKVSQVSLHTKTAIFIAEKLTEARFDMVSIGSNVIIKCIGVGLKNRRN